IPQTINGAGLVFEERNHLELAAKIERLLNFPDLNETLITAGLERAKGFSWQTLAKINREAYTAALETYHR
ncbi:MAG: glycosyltransferase family 4 protein, partial [Chlorobiales bacterium]|nr:glycosyltransferase family 4 protein [Chlorobiales bacterium]